MAALALGTTIAGMVGLHFGVEYSGWVLFLGLLGTFGVLA